jgi:hypothetical protein
MVMRYSPQVLMPHAKQLSSRGHIALQQGNYLIDIQRLTFESDNCGELKGKDNIHDTTKFHE